MENKQYQRILGLDFGSKTVGVAISDPLCISAQGLEIIRRERSNKLRQTCARIDEIIALNHVSSIVLGYPYHLNFDEGQRCAATKDFADMLIKRTHLPLYLVDERLSSSASHQAMKTLGIKGNKKKDYVDEIAAMWILQGYLDGISMGNEVTPYDGKNHI